jgi:hypothetical protein
VSLPKGEGREVTDDELLPGLAKAIIVVLTVGAMLLIVLWSR